MKAVSGTGLVTIATTLLLPIAAFAACVGEEHEECQLQLMQPTLQGYREPVLLERIKLNQNSRVEDSQSKPGLIANMGSHVIIGEHAVVGDVYAVGKVFLKRFSAIEGHAVAGDIRLETSSVAPRKFRHPSAQDIQETRWTVEYLPNDTGNVVVPDNSAAVLLPGRYGRVTVGEKANLTLHTGTYYLDALETAGPESRLVLDNPEGTIVVYVSGHVIHKGVFAPRYAKSDLLLVYTGDKPLHFYSPFDASVIAPYAELSLYRLADGVAHNGTYYARSISVKDEAVVREAKISNKGPAIAGLLPQLRSAPLAIAIEQHEEMGRPMMESLSN